MHCLESRCFAALIQRLYIGDHSNHRSIPRIPRILWRSGDWPWRMSSGHTGCRFCQNDSPDSMITRGQIPRSMTQKTQALKSCRKRFSLKRPPGESGLTKRIGGFGWRDNVDKEVSGFSGLFFAVKTQGEFCYVNYMTRKKIDQSWDICKAWWPKVRDFRFWFYSTWDGYLKRYCAFFHHLTQRTNELIHDFDWSNWWPSAVRQKKCTHPLERMTAISKNLCLLAFFPI